MSARSRNQWVDDSSTDRVGAAIAASMRRKLAGERSVAGAVRVLAPHSSGIARAAEGCLDKLARRGAFTRPLYGACARSMAEIAPERATHALLVALKSVDAGGLVTLSAVSLCNDDRLAEPLQRAATLPSPLIAFGAELARVLRSESDGRLIAALAPKIKESHRILLCSQLLLPLLARTPLPRAALPALRVLRESERHLGRWLLLAELELRSGDATPLRVAQARRRAGPESTKMAWTHVCWALGGPAARLPRRTTTDVVFRLSDRPSAERDASFLFRMARAREPAAAALLESLCESATPGAGAIRAAAHLVDDYGRGGFRRPIVRAATSAGSDKLRGLAAASLFDIGEHELAQEVGPRLTSSRQLTSVAWGALLQLAQRGRAGPLVTDRTYRCLEQGLVA